MGDASGDGVVKVYRCPECTGIWPKEDPPHQRRCPRCGVRVQRKMIPADASLVVEPHPLEDNPFNLESVIHRILKFGDAVSHAAFSAQELAERLSERDPNAPEEYVDKVEFDARIFNRRAQMVGDMLTTQSLLQEAGLEAYIDEALMRILDAKIAPNIRVVNQVVSEPKGKKKGKG